MIINEKVKWLQLNYPELCKDMNDGTHHYDKKYLSKYHIEGSIWSHTMMVAKLSEIYDFDDILQWSALLHDIGKPYCTVRNHEDHRARSHNHESYSTFLAIDILNNLELPVYDKQMILQIINHHAILLDGIDDNGKIKSNILDKFMGNKELFKYLMLFAKIDIMGRFHEHSNRNNLGKNLYEYFLNDIVKIPDIYYPKSHKTVTLLIGLPASGKSTYCKEHFSDAYRISRDDIIEKYGKMMNLNYNEAFAFYSGNNSGTIETELQHMANDALRKLNVVVDMTNLTIKSRKRWLKHFKDYNKECIVFFTGMNDIKYRNTMRDGKIISDDVYSDMMRRLSLPLYCEGFSKISYVGLK